jgi:hypothetical protein
MGIQRGGDERVAQCVGPDRLGDPGPPGDAVDDPPSAVPVQRAATRSEEDRSLGPFAGGQVETRVSLSLGDSLETCHPRPTAVLVRCLAPVGGLLSDLGLDLVG